MVARPQGGDLIIPTDQPVTVTFKNNSGTTGSAVIGPKSLVSVDPTLNTEVSDTWIPWNGGDGGEVEEGETKINYAADKMVTVSSTLQSGLQLILNRQNG